MPCAVFTNIVFLYFGNPTAYFAATAGDCTKPSVKILATIITNFVPFLAILFVTFEYYRNLGAGSPN
jgi:hypothetical protein